MGNTQISGSRKDRYSSSDSFQHEYSLSGSGGTGHGFHRHRHHSSGDESCPVQLKSMRHDSSHQHMHVHEPLLIHKQQTQHDYPVVIKWNNNKHRKARDAAISGSWDGWRQRVPMVESQEDFVTIVNLPEGRHEFKFLVDGIWQCDDRLEKTGNNLGTENNVIVINKEDFEIFSALDKDLAECLQHSSQNTFPDPAADEPMDVDHGSTNDGTSSNTPSSSGSRHSPHASVTSHSPRRFSQLIPERRMFEMAAQKPPILPPHLLQVILNKGTPESVDPNCLPEPNHVMLNHLYALSIKDGIMVLSATHRHYKKYCTTVLYKPISIPKS